MDIETKVVQHVSCPKESDLTTLNLTPYTFLFSLPWDSLSHCELFLFWSLKIIGISCVFLSGQSVVHCTLPAHLLLYNGLLISMASSVIYWTRQGLTSSQCLSSTTSRTIGQIISKFLFIIENYFLLREKYKFQKSPSFSRETSRLYSNVHAVSPLVAHLRCREYVRERHRCVWMWPKTVWRAPGGRQQDTTGHTEIPTPASNGINTGQTTTGWHCTGHWTRHQTQKTPWPRPRSGECCWVQQRQF